MKKINIFLLGYGQVGKNFFRLVQEKQDFCRRKYEHHICVSTVLNSRGGLYTASEKKGEGMFTGSALGSKLEEHPDYVSGMDFENVLEYPDLDILVDCTPSDIRTGKPSLDYTHRALNRGMHVVTASKGPLVVDFAGIRTNAEKNSVCLGMSGATAAALPTLDVALRSLAGAEILGIEGILNGTSNYVLTRMSEGMTYAQALNEAQRKGMAEPNPEQDVEGWDTAAKILIITNAVMGTSYTLEDMRVEGITNISSSLWKEAKKTGHKLKLIGRFSPQRKTQNLETRLSPIHPSHSLYGVDGAAKGITFFTDTMNTVTVTGGKSDPRGAAAALLKDVLNIYRG
jgi:homoserine dehydrogenase